MWHVRPSSASVIGSRHSSYLRSAFGLSSPFVTCVQSFLSVLGISPSISFSSAASAILIGSTILERSGCGAGAGLSSLGGSFGSSFGFSTTGSFGLSGLLAGFSTSGSSFFGFSFSGLGFSFSGFSFSGFASAAGLSSAGFFFFFFGLGSSSFFGVSPPEEGSLLL